MIAIKRGPMLERYALIYNCPIDEVVSWMNGYVNGPWVETLVPHIEPTEQERMDSIKGYVSGMISCSTYGRIKASLAKERECSNQTSVQCAEP